MRDYLKKIHADVQVHTWYDQGVLVSPRRPACATPSPSACCWPAAVLLGFLRSWKITIVAILVVPAVLVITALVLYLPGWA